MGQVTSPFVTRSGEVDVRCLPQPHAFADQIVGDPGDRPFQRFGDEIDVAFGDGAAAGILKARATLSGAGCQPGGRTVG